MIFDDGGTPIEFYPAAYGLRVQDRTELQIAHTGAVIAADSVGGLPPRRFRDITFQATTAGRAALKTFFDANLATTFLFTDEVGRVWNARWLGKFVSSEVAYTSVGDHRVEAELLLESVNSDAGREAYANVDASQMSIQKSGGAILYFPVAYTHPLQKTEVATAKRELTPGFLAVDAARHTARTDAQLTFENLPRAFVSVLEDYVVATLEGALYPFTLIHFRDGSTVYRLTSGLALTYNERRLWDGAMTVREET